MHPVSPVIPGENFQETIVAEHQDEYMNLPVISCGDGVILSRWELSEEELKTVSETKSVWHFMHTFGNPVTPVSLQVERPETEADEEVEFMTVLQFTEVRAQRAQDFGIEFERGVCSECKTEVIVSEGSLKAIARKPDIKIICTLCAEKINQSGKFCILPETFEELKNVAENPKTGQKTNEAGK